MTAIVEHSVHARRGAVRAQRALVAALVIAIAGAGALLMGARSTPDALGALLLGISLVPVTVSLVASLMITLAGALTAFRAYLAVSMTVFVTVGAVGDLGTALPADYEWAARVLTVVSVFGFLPVAYFFPNGRPAPTWSPWMLGGWIGAALLALAFGWDPYPPVATAVLAVLAVTLLLSLVACQLWRYVRVSTLVERQQTKWLLAALMAIALLETIVIALPQGSVSADPALRVVFAVSGGLAATALATAIGIAMLQHRLFDIDLLIGRGVAVVSVVVLVTLAYVVVVAAASFAWPRDTPAVVSIVAAALAGAAVVPAHRLALGLANRWMYGEPHSPAAVLSRLSADLTQTSDLEPTLQRIADTLLHSLRLARVEAVVPDRTSAQSDSGRQASDASVDVPITFEGRELGMLRLWPAAGDGLREREREMAREVALAAGVSVHASLVVDRLERSRAGLVLAREQERARLQRELHDGVGPTLASVTQRVARARVIAASDPLRVAALLETAQTGIADATIELRAAISGLRPPALDHLGVVGALRTAWDIDGAATEITVKGEPGELDPAVGIAAYRIAMEAVGNAVRHARATVCTVSFTIQSDALCVVVEDDGVGGAQRSPDGAGLDTMRTRAEELGGSLDIDDIHPGTRVTAILPLGSTS